MKTPMQFKKTVLASLIGASLVAIAAAPVTSWAQTSNATLRGHAPANTQITAFNVATGVTRHTTSNASGRYTLVGLPPGTYQISAGSGKAKTVTLSVASTATLDLSAAAQSNAASTTAAQANAQNLSTVTVSGTALHEVKTPEISTTISQHQIQTIPQISRNFLEFADTVPGMVFTVNAQGNTSLRGGAQNDSQVNVYIDGVGQKSYVMGGGVAGQNSSQGNPFPELAIGQYKVITSNYKAEYGQISSAAVTAQTKSGTNQFHGEVFDRYTNDGYRAATPSENAKGKKASSQEKEFGFSLGGPIIKDQMHFFLAYSGKRFVEPIAVVPASNATPGVPYLPSDVASQLGPANLPFLEDLYFGKLDWEPTDRDRFELSAKIRNEHQRQGVGGVTAVSAGISNINTDKRYTLKWDHSADLWFNDLILGHEYTFFQPTPLNFGNGAIYTYPYSSTQDATIIDTGPASPLAAQNKGQKGYFIKDNLTFNDLQWHGNHVIKMGFVYRDITLKAEDAANENPQFYYNVTPSGTASTPYEAFFTKPVEGLGLTPTVVTNDKQFGAYVQDDWDVTDRLQLNLGVRWDYEKDPSYTNFVTPANVVAALEGPNTNPNAPPGQTYAQALAAGGINVNDYISNGHNRSAFKGEWQPRLGFSYDINDDQAHVIHGGVGRSYDRNLYNYLQLETTKAALPQFREYFRPQGVTSGPCHQGKTPCVNWDPKYLNGLSNLQALLGASSNAGAEVDLLNNHLKAPYSDQFSLGMSNQLGDWQTDATVTRVLYYDGFAFTLGNRYPDGAFFKNNSQPWGDGIPGFGSLIVGNNGIRTRNTQLLLSAKKPYTKASGWGATFAYTYSDAVQNRDINEHYSFDYATINNYPFISSNAVAKHRFVATGNVSGPWGLVFAAKLTLATPIPLNTSACYSADSGNQFPNGSLCHATAGMPSNASKFLVGGKIWGYRDVDFQATKNFHFGHGITAYARFDLLNVFNFKNYVDYSTDYSAGPYNGMVSYNETGNITYVPRTIKFEVGARF